MVTGQNLLPLSVLSFFYREMPRLVTLTTKYGAGEQNIEYERETRNRAVEHRARQKNTNGEFGGEIGRPGFPAL